MAFKMLRWPGAVFDQPNQNVYPAQATRSLNVSAGFEIESGAPLTVFAAYPSMAAAAKYSPYAEPGSRRLTGSVLAHRGPHH